MKTLMNLDEFAQNLWIMTLHKVVDPKLVKESSIYRMKDGRMRKKDECGTKHKPMALCHLSTC